MVEALSNLKAASRTPEIAHECGPRHTRVLIIDEGLSRVSFAIGDRAHAYEAGRVFVRTERRGRACSIR